ncbi:MAG: Ig-like domain-containing protein [Desulfuromonadaceae bacterium]|nr:Ig-like domain-containing protein [Desulfuromonadaceae bacterium]
MNDKRTAYSKMWFLLLLLVTFVAGCASNPDEILVVPDTVAPKVSVTSPTNTAVAVPLNRKVSVGFSEAMDPATITTATFKVTGPGLTPVTGTVTTVGTTATFTPDSNLAISTIYTATITTGVKDLAGNAMANDFVFTFTTGTSTDTTTPIVIATVNADNAVNVPTNTKVGATFSEVMDPLTLTPATFALKQGITTVPGTVTYSGVNAVFTPANILATNTNYTATITTGAKDQAGNPMASNYVWSFTTAAVADTTKPTVILVNPADLATNVAINSAVHATFSKSMDPLTISTASFTLKNGANPVNGLVTYNATNKIASFTPSANLATDTTYTATITTEAADLSGNTLLEDKVWSFTTAAAIVPPIEPPASQLGSAGTYGIMATSAITNTGATTMINGDVALEPGSENGLLPAQVNGEIHINDTVSHQAFADLLVAYNYYKNLPPGVTITAGADLGALYPLGMPPGTYTSGTSMSINTHLTLDGGGDANAVWVFQIGSSITTTTPLGTISLINGANANNVFWVPTASATIGVGTTFYGTVIAGVSITGQTGALINGRLLAGAIGAGTIALDTNTVNVP